MSELNQFYETGKGNYTNVSKNKHGFHMHVYILIRMWYLRALN